MTKQECPGSLLCPYPRIDALWPFQCATCSLKPAEREDASSEDAPLAILSDFPSLYDSGELTTEAINALAERVRKVM